MGHRHSRNDRDRDRDSRDRGDRNKSGFDTGLNVIKKRPCKFCADKALVMTYKDPRLLKYFLTERGRIIPRRISGNCSKHQRELCTAIKRARNIALLSFTAKDF
jgi:small subunit ribosomal protein S18